MAKEEKSKTSDQNRNGTTEPSKTSATMGLETFYKMMGLKEDPTITYDNIRKTSNKMSVQAISTSYDNTTNIAEQAAKNDKYYNKQTSLMKTILVPQALYGVGGMPACFLNNTDPPGPLNKQGIGTYYIDNVIQKGQFIVFKPGFLTWNIGADAIQSLKEGADLAIGLVAKFFSGELTEVRGSADDYWFDVERANRILIYMMGLEDVTFPFAIGGQAVNKMSLEDRIGNQGGGSMAMTVCKFGQMSRKHWRNIGMQFANVVAAKGGYNIGGWGKEVDQSKDGIQDAGVVPFYVDGKIEVSNSLNNATANNPMHDAAQALMGDTNSVLKQAIGMIGWGGRKLDETGVVGFFTGQPLTPQVWTSSSYEKSFSCTLRFTSPSGDPVSSFMNCLYPLNKLMILAMPLGVGGFQTSPSIVSIFSMGAINTKYGMITGLNIQKSIETMTDTGLPTEIDVQVTMQDLAPFIYKERPGWFTKTVSVGAGYSNFMATLAGINVTVIPHSRLRDFNLQMVKIDALSAGKVMLENAVFAVQNFAGKFVRNWNDGGDDYMQRWAMVSGRVSGLFGLGNNYVPRVKSETTYQNMWE